MDSQGKLSGFLRRWRQARYEVKQAKNARRDARDAEELQMAKVGLSPRPGSHGMGGL